MLVEVVCVAAAVCAGDLHPYGSATCSERLRGCDKPAADALAAGLVGDDESHDPARRLGAYEEWAEVDRDEAEQVAVGIGNVGCAGGILSPVLDSVCRCRGAILRIAKLVKQF